MRKIVLFIILALMLALTLASSTLAQEDLPPPSTPGVVYGFGVNFEVTDSDWLNVTLDSSVPVELNLTSSPEIILLDISAVSDDPLANIVMGGFEPNASYWRYDDASETGIQFTADASGSYELSLDLSSVRTIRIQSVKSTHHIEDDGVGGTGRDCADIGSWDGATKTCTLIQDVYETIVVSSPGVTLDGAGNTVYVGSSGYVQAAARDQVVKNINIAGATQSCCGYGLYLANATNAVVNNVTISDRYYGIRFHRSAGVTVSDSSVTDAQYGLYAYQSDGNVIANNDFSSVNYGTWMLSSDSNTIEDNELLGATSAQVGFYPNYSNDNTFVGNTVSDFVYGVWIRGFDYTDEGWRRGNYSIYSNSQPSKSNIVYRNNFLNVIRPLRLDQGQYVRTWYVDPDNYGTYTWNYNANTGNVFNLPAPDGGNYYSQFDEPAEGCSDNNSDGFCDAPFNGINAVDNLPRTSRVAGDDTPPEISATLSGATATNGWYTGDVVITWSVSDEESEATVDSGCADLAVDYDTDGKTFTCTATSAGGTTQESVTIKRDATAPELTIDTPQLYDVQPAGTALAFAASDGLSGVDGTAVATVTDAEGPSSANSGDVLEPGVYTVVITATDLAGNTRTSEPRLLVIYDPEGGFVTGGGWIDSPEGAYVGDPGLTGKASFGFVSKYKNKGGVSELTGNTEFQFKAGGLNFHSTSYDWLVVPGKTQAKFKGQGVVNGVDGYGFMLTAQDNGSSGDTFRIKIWDANDDVVYDNHAVADDSYDGTVIGGGSIVIHTRGK